jgi:hypothetical protein
MRPATEAAFDQNRTPPSIAERGEGAHLRYGSGEVGLIPPSAWISRSRDLEHCIGVDHPAIDSDRCRSHSRPRAGKIDRNPRHIIGSIRSRDALGDLVRMIACGPVHVRLECTPLRSPLTER